MSALAKVEPKTLAVVENELMSREQLELLKATICAGSTDNEFSLFVNVCKRLRLDPFARQIFAVKRYDSNERRDVMAVQVSVDGLRLVAERTGEYLGQTKPEWCGADGVWRDVWLSKEKPSAARVGVRRRGFVEPLYAVALWDEFVQKKRDGGVTAMWDTKSTLMLRKCAESLALRQAFPAELSGVYTEEEMGQASNPEGAYLDAEQLAIAARKAKEKDDADALCDEWIAEVEKFTEAEHVAKFLHYNGAAMRTMHANAKQRFWRRLLKVGERVNLGAAAMKGFIAEAPEFPHDEDGVVNGEVMEGEAAQ